MYNFQMNQYYNTNSIIHKLNPLCKIICILIFTFLVLFTNNIILLSLLLVLVFYLIYLSYVPIDLYLNNIKYLIPFIIFIFIINLLFSNVLSGISSIIKLILFILYSSLLIYTTKQNDLIYGLKKFLSPLKLFGIDTSSLALTLSLAIRFIPTIFEEGKRVYKSQISRGLNFNGNLSEKCDKLISVIIPVFNLSLERADDVSFILDTRFYRVKEKRTEYKNRSFNVIDDNVLLVHLALLILFLVLEVIL